MNQVKEFGTAIRSTLILWLIVAVMYPLMMLAVGELFVPFQAHGSILRNRQSQAIGSALIGQPFTSDKYFWSRPSTIDYSAGKTAAPTGGSGASNLAPSNPDLPKRTKVEIDRLKAAGIKPTNDLVYTSGSGLDPHISLESARNQIPRVARARGLDTNKVEIIMTQSIEDRFLGIFGEPGVNVLNLNLALDKLT
ncbi:MAG: K(+)-transporting ATPase subunit C [Chamaesiphon sp.]|nr:K(+)-transporting ATPase subunit C [Chamaesiphon sp.]